MSESFKCENEFAPMTRVIRLEREQWLGEIVSISARPACSNLTLLLLPLLRRSSITRTNGSADEREMKEERRIVLYFYGHE
jgi:hypothetical protein